jgi:hypothetical protein
MAGKKMLALLLRKSKANSSGALSVFWAGLYKRARKMAPSVRKSPCLPSQQLKSALWVATGRTGSCKQMTPRQ